MKKENLKTLIYGIGNISRQDDALGILFVEQIEKIFVEKENLKFESNYQLNMEDALMISEYDKVIFVDASKNKYSEGFNLSELEPSDEITFSTHSMKPEMVLSLCHNLYDKYPDCYLLAIQGFEWELQQGISEAAHHNLLNALMFFQNSI